MNLEGISLKLLTDYLVQELTGSKIYKVFMPNNQSLLLQLRRSYDATALVCDLGGGSPTLFIPERAPENPEVPPAFCMLLRKHLEEGRITRIYQQELDRVIILEIDMLGPQSRIITKQLIFELAGKNSNILLVQDGQIIDCLKHIGASQSSYRQLLPARPYMPPPAQAGLDILRTDPTELTAHITKLPAPSLLKALISGTVGIGRITAAELLHTAGIQAQELILNPGAPAALSEAIAELQTALNKEPGAAPVYALISRTNQVKTILPLEPHCLDEGESSQSFANINEAIRYSISLKPIQLPQHEELSRIVAGEESRLQHKLQALEKDLMNAENADEQREIADSLMACIYLLKKGQTQATIMNIYNGEDITVALSPILSPTENAQAYYKRYNKYKRAQKEVAVQYEQTEAQLAYLESLEASLLTAATKNEIEEIRQEMVAQELIRQQNKKKNKPNLPKPQPQMIKLHQDAYLYVGKNNKQNDYVTFTLAGPKDLWFHTKDIPGSHVVLKTTLSQPKEEDILQAAQTAAFYSKGRNAGRIAVDYVERRLVKKPSGAKPGFVTFTGQRTLYVEPVEPK